MALHYGEEDGAYEAGLVINDRSGVPITEQAILYERIQTMSDEAEKSRLIAQLGEGVARRVSVMRISSGEPGIEVCDSNGRPRIRMVVDAHDEPRLEFLDANGNVALSLPGPG